MVGGRGFRGGGGEEQHRRQRGRPTPCRPRPGPRLRPCPRGGGQAHPTSACRGAGALRQAGQPPTGSPPRASSPSPAPDATRPCSPRRCRPESGRRRTGDIVPGPGRPGRGGSPLAGVDGRGPLLCGGGWGEGVGTALHPADIAALLAVSPGPRPLSVSSRSGRDMVSRSRRQRDMARVGAGLVPTPGPPGTVAAPSARPTPGDREHGARRADAAAPPAGVAGRQPPAGGRRRPRICSICRQNRAASLPPEERGQARWLVGCQSMLTTVVPSPLSVTDTA
jgi:hypothetical protein